jgi:hypothetical protein
MTPTPMVEAWLRSLVTLLLSKMLNFADRLQDYRTSCQILANALIPTGDAQFNAKHPRNPDGTFAEKPKPQAGLLQSALTGVVVAGLGLQTIGYLGKRRNQFNKANRKANAAAAAKTAADNITKQQRETKEALDKLARLVAEREEKAKAKAKAAAARAATAQRKAKELIEQNERANQKAIQIGKRLNRRGQALQVARAVAMRRGRGENPVDGIEAMKWAFEDHFFARAQRVLRGSANRLDNLFEETLLSHGTKAIRWRESQLKLLQNKHPKPSREEFNALDRQLNERIKQAIGSIPDIGVQKDEDYSIIAKIQELDEANYTEQMDRRAVQFLQQAAKEVEQDRQSVLDTIDKAVTAAKERVEQGLGLQPPVLKKPRKRKAKAKSPTQGQGFGKV